MKKEQLTSDDSNLLKDKPNTQYIFPSFDRHSDMAKNIADLHLSRTASGGTNMSIALQEALSISADKQTEKKSNFPTIENVKNHFNSLEDKFISEKIKELDFSHISSFSGKSSDEKFFDSENVTLIIDRTSLNKQTKDEPTLNKSQGLKNN